MHYVNYSAGRRVAMGNHSLTVIQGGDRSYPFALMPVGSQVHTEQQLLRVVYRVSPEGAWILLFLVFFWQTSIIFLPFFSAR